MALGEGFPVLEYLILGSWTEGATLTLAETLQAPHLRRLALSDSFIPVESRSLMTAVGIVTLCLYLNHPSEYLQPNTLLRWISSIPKIDMLIVVFAFYFPDSGVERQLIHAPITTYVELSSLRRFGFQGVGTYLEAIVCQIAAPQLEMLNIWLFKLLTFSFSHLLQLMDTTKNLRFDSTKFEFFREHVAVKFYPHKEDERYPLFVFVFCLHLNWQVSSVIQIFKSLGQISSTSHSRTQDP